MKKLFTLALSCFILLSANTFAQQADSLKKKSKAKAKTAVSKADKKAKDATATTEAAATKTADDTKDVATKKATKAKTAATKTAAEGVNKSEDKAIGKDAKGRTIYLGPKGGQYTVSESGKKVYIKTADKLKVN
jgi:colicin import membrane protein